MTARSHGEVTLLDLRSIGLTKGPTCWRTVRGTANDSERQRTSANVSERQRTSAKGNERERTSVDANNR